MVGEPIADRQIDTKKDIQTNSIMQDWARPSIITYEIMLYYSPKSYIIWL